MFHGSLVPCAERRIINMIDETLQKTYLPLKLAEVGKSCQHENIIDKENNIKDNDEQSPWQQKKD